jgi:PAS domain S-box-containing protein
MPHEDAGQLMTTGRVDSDDVDGLIASIHATPFASIVTDNRQPDNPIIAANEPFTRLTGYTPEEILGRNCRFLAGRWTEPDATSALRESVANGEPIVVELTNYKKDRSTFRNAVMIAPVRDNAGNVILFVGSQMEVKATDSTGIRREHARSRIATLTPRQREILEFVGRGFMSKQIAYMLNISVKTVETHRAQLVRALGVKTSTQAIRIAIEASLVGSRTD